MLEGNYSEKLTALLSHLSSAVQLPVDWETAQHGLGRPAFPSDMRRFARITMRSDAICEVLPTLNAIERSHGLVKVHTKDISKCGVAFLMPMQMYPREQVILWTRSGKLRCEIKRCVKVRDKCYEVGAEFPDEKKR